MPVCLIGIGSNLGNRRQTLDRAVDRLREEPDVCVIRQSRWHETAPVGGPSGQQPFLNGALVLETALAPEAVLSLLNQIEDQQGRQRAKRWGPRSLDLDLLLYDRLVLESAALCVPHPRMAWRRFVLESAVEVAAEMVHPTTGWSLARLLDHLNTSPYYLAVAGPIGVGKTYLAERFHHDASASLISEHVDLDRLDTFYRDPSSHAWAVELEFLNQRLELLDAESPRWSQTQRLQVSDFWFDQSLAYAKVWIASERRREFADRWHEASSGVVRPRLTVLLDAPVEQIARQIRRRGRNPEMQLKVELLERIRHEIVGLLDRPDCGPILRLMNDDPDRVWAEVSAAAEAMK